MTKQLLFALFIILSIHQSLNAQSFRIEDLKQVFGKGNPLKFSGGLSANSVFNAGNQSSGRDPFTYYLNGSANLNIYGYINLPFSFSLTNSGSSYQLPSSPNRFSMSPSYKWLTAHIGDVSMTFSPYTLSGHIFSGIGVEANPEGWEIAAMYGRLQKAVEVNEERPSFIPTYKRMGYGFKVGKITEKIQVMANIFTAKDKANSLVYAPDSLGVTPMDNLAGSLSFVAKPVRFLEISGEFGISLLTTDTRAPYQHKDGILNIWSGSNSTSTYYTAFKGQINYVGSNNRFGVGFERIDPGYQTLGAYYFNNDFENITLNGYQSLFDNKVSITASLGLEHDDLADRKTSKTNRVVTSGNLNFMPSDRFNANLSYSNFQTHTNVRSNFELINQENPLDRLDTLNFVQLSQSANLNLNIITKKNEAEMHNLGMNISYQDAANKQGGVYHPGSVTEMINAGASYSWMFLASGLSLNGAVNFNNSKILNGNTLTWGPTLGVSSKIWNKKINLSGSISYNTGSLEGIKQNEVFMYRLNSSYSPIERHSITLAYDFQWRSSLTQPTTNNTLVTIGYACSF